MLNKFAGRYFGKSIGGQFPARPEFLNSVPASDGVRARSERAVICHVVWWSTPVCDRSLAPAQHGLKRGSACRSPNCSTSTIARPPSACDRQDAFGVWPHWQLDFRKIFEATTWLEAELRTIPPGTRDFVTRDDPGNCRGESRALRT